MNRLDQIARRFPLVARPRPACPPLGMRVRDVCDLARAADAPDGDRLALAASAHNKAALIASDCSLPDFARSLCWRQFDIYQHAQPLSGRAAQYALEPIVNLARLRIREGSGQAAYNLLDTLFHAVRSGSAATIDGRVLDFHEFTASTEDHHAVCRWLWAVLLADGTRALTSAGQWATALAYIEGHRGVGLRMLDGRQIAILAHRMVSDPDTALEIIRNSAPVEPWEHAVTACLDVLCQPSTDTVTVMIESYLKLDPTPEHLVFCTRLGLAILDLADDIRHPGATRVATRVADGAMTGKDGYAARDVTAHTGCTARLTAAQTQELSNMVKASGLDLGDIPAPLLSELHSAITASESVTARFLTS